MCAQPPKPRSSCRSVTRRQFVDKTVIKGELLYFESPLPKEGKDFDNKPTVKYTYTSHANY